MLKQVITPCACALLQACKSRVMTCVPHPLPHTDACRHPAHVPPRAGVQKQIRDLRIEACLIRTAVSFLLAAILLFLASGVLLAASSLNPRCEGPAVGVFLAALAAFALAILLMLSESFLLVHPVLIEERHLKRIISASYVGGACCSGSGGSANSGSHASLTIFAA